MNEGLLKKIEDKAQIIDYIIDPVILINKENLLINFFNYESEIFFSISREKIANKHINFLFGKSSSITDYIKYSLKKNGVYKFNDLYINFGKGYNNYNIEIVNNEDLNFIIIIIKVQDKVKKNNEVKTDLLYLDETLEMIAHELKNPLSSIRGAAQLTQKSDVVDVELIEIIIKECDRIKKLIDSFQINLDKDFSQKTINIHKTLRYVIKKNKLKCSESINYIEEFDPSLPNININELNIIQVFDNLISNSIDSLKKRNDERFIKIITRFKSGSIRSIPNLKNKVYKSFIQIIFEDNGEGIDSEIIQKIFHPFFTTKTNGKGIGLYLVRKIITQMGGSIDLFDKKSTTQFIIHLPII